MACTNKCNLCDNLILSTSVAFTDGQLVIDIPLNEVSGPYKDGCKYCIVVAQAIPDGVTIGAPVVISIGGVATPTYPLVDKCCRQISAEQIKPRCRYATEVMTTATGGSFKLLGCITSAASRLASLPAPSTTTPGA